MKTIKLTKMQGLGNDFVILDYDQFEKANMTMAELAVKLCDRNFGVGADGMIIPNLNPAKHFLECEGKESIAFTPDIGWYFYNSDGTTAQMCGNGIRCFAKYVTDKKLVTRKRFTVETLAGIIAPELLDDGTVKVNMSRPILISEKIPINISNCYSSSPLAGEDRGEGCRCLNFPLEIDDKTFKINAVSMGNPHCVIFVEDDSDLLSLAKTYGPKIENHPIFPEKTNVEFIKIKSRNEMDLRVFERGCGITLACGTGACASVVAAILNNLTDSKVKVNLLGGALTIEWQGSLANPNFDVYMTGPAQYSFFAEYIL